MRPSLAPSSSSLSVMLPSVSASILFVLSLPAVFQDSVLHRTAAFAPNHLTLLPAMKYRARTTHNAHSPSNEESGKNTNDDDQSRPSWYLPSDHPESATRRERLVRMQEDMQRFAHGSELQDLRLDIASLKENLKWALATDDITRIIDLTAAIEKAQVKDPEFVYKRMLEKIEDAQKMNVSKKYQVLPKITEEALAARRYIPRLNMEGLWIGNFGTEGSGLVNVTYVGDTLIATKVTGECVIPKGEVLFRADLSPPSDKNSKEKLDPIPLTGSVASKFGTQKLERYFGEGQLSSSEDFKDCKFVEGQLIMFDGYFSFLYLPSKQHIFFSRPSPELTLHLMRDIISVEDELENMKDHLTRCFNKDMDTSSMRPSKKQKEENLKEQETERDPFRRILREQDLSAAEDDLYLKYEYQKWVPSTSKDDTKFSFWAFHKWFNYLDSVLKPQNGKNDGL
mmetsp:Transcript_27327/g.41141  ORF Transcript_27327/g.41141 Transcript_27327/m.41141 type:complete len:453 (-) Transcript_27327:138-1496(-)|eukprot:CAMPEP_0203663330 /NCGR_PEP_ID=MMETSP0090-20130426/947_1 /ASSEMBLY_ACC=CAM_ASM_001088 /TAXON_ID=426623 /ORGANISM="Chaetoceros affinis, Strain CCMP159" /LENGTH=452 /DNA_ID=CAMNT_0050526217 /DNA_START=38 /DNA_END=1396 /DNA_ORIENTATION=-